MIIINIYLILLLISTIIYLINPKRQAVLYCGIFAFYGDNKYFSRDKFNILGIFNDSRGGDACGIGSNNYLETFCGTHSKYFCNSIADFKELPTSNFYLGHTRATSANNLISKGVPVYSQPLKFSKTSVGVHNGTLYNVEALAKEFKICLEFKVNNVSYKGNDSMLLLYTLLAKNDYSILTKYIGAAALIWHNKEEDSFNFFHGKSKNLAHALEEERPLYILKNTDNDSIWLSSMYNSLEAIMIPNSYIEEVPFNTVFTYKNNKLYSETIFDRSESYVREPYVYTNVNYASNRHWNHEGFYEANKPKNNANLTTKPIVPNINEITSDVTFVNGRYYCMGAKMCGKFYINEYGKCYSGNTIHPGFSIYYFYSGYLIRSKNEYKALKKAIFINNKDITSETSERDLELNSVTILNLVAEYSQYPVNIFEYMNSTKWVVYSSVLGKTIPAEITLSPKFSKNYKYVFTPSGLTQTFIGPTLAYDDEDFATETDFETQVNEAFKVIENFQSGIDDVESDPSVIEIDSTPIAVETTHFIEDNKDAEDIDGTEDDDDDSEKYGEEEAIEYVQDLFEEIYVECAATEEKLLIVNISQKNVEKFNTMNRKIKIIKNTLENE